MKKTNRRHFIKQGVASTALAAITGSALSAQATPSQTAGPFYPITPQKDQDFDLTQIDGHTQKALGEVVVIHGQVVDTKGDPIDNATVDIWQANAAGRYNHPHDTNTAPLDPHFQGWAIVQSGENGGFKFKTIIPGAYPVSAEWSRPPHIHFKVSKAGFQEVVTQMYFPDNPLNDVDKLLQSKDAHEQKMMIANADEEQKDRLNYQIVMAAV
ncbi:protocatechuate 3,4-dioxygenase [Marinicella sp. S1101]|uniref:protocatechuate 3,4-dioxygenase n=1 Tax=Marinicella marina TaxID=2996016 RepID=UPI002260CC34|nr:protocatechuate 3,4-dioxygenase [Marinicella marina]MCX7552751.1 protocatechuate 3,4-dioxygenase [Marinicella marina]MDJ1139940.1 protocatechuate 3,4-dioxygenase [Marinicella marina]